MGHSTRLARRERRWHAQHTGQAKCVRLLCARTDALIDDAATAKGQRSVERGHGLNLDERRLHSGRRLEGLGGADEHESEEEATLHDDARGPTVGGWDQGVQLLARDENGSFVCHGTYRMYQGAYHGVYLYQLAVECRDLREESD